MHVKVCIENTVGRVLREFFLKSIQSRFLFLVKFFLLCFSFSAEGRSVEVCARIDSDVVRAFKGINFGNALEDTRAAVWGMYPKSSDFDFARKSGFNMVRLPINWAAHVDDKYPYLIDPIFQKRVDAIVADSLQAGFYVVLDFHQYTASSRLGAAELVRFVSIWRQLSKRYAGFSDRLIFELLNEPNGLLNGEEWNRWIEQALRVVREDNKKRLVVIAPAKWSNIEGLSDLRVPCDFNTILSFHYYRPFQFTHQGVWWISQAKDWVGRSWPSFLDSEVTIRSDFESVLDWASRNGFRSVFLGEFGVYRGADEVSRRAWIRSVRSVAESLRIGWAFWSLRRDFGLLADGSDEVDRLLVDSLFK